MRTGEQMTIGFLGLGVMGEPMAQNLLAAGTPLAVWNRSAEKARALASRGAFVAADPAAVFAAAEIVIVMLANDYAIDDVLGRHEASFAELVSGRTLVNMGTVPPAYSAALAEDITRHGGDYVEAPVSGSRRPAEEGTLVAMLAGEANTVTLLEPILKPMCARQVYCGAKAPQAMMTKLAVNIHLITLVTGLVEAFHFAQVQGVDPHALAEVFAAGPMSSALTRVKAEKLLAGDLTPQAHARDVHFNSRLIAQAGRDADTPLPLLDACEQLFAQTVRMGYGEEDFIAVMHALRAR